MAGPTNTVGEILPAGFDAYVRLPHPYWRDVPEGTIGAIFDPSGSSAEGGVWTKPVLGAEATIPDEAGLWPPIEGVMGAPTVMSAVTDVLRAETGNVTCLCGFWKRGEPSGGGNITDAAGPATVAQLLIRLFLPFGWVQTMLDLARQRQTGGPPKEVMLYRGGFDDTRRWISEFAAMMTYYPLPTAFWPEDRRWCVALPQNKSFSFAAGPRKLMDRILALPDIDALEVKLSDNVWDGS